MKEWIVRLKGAQADLQDLAKVFKSGNIIIYEDDGNFYLKSPALNNLFDSESVQTEAGRLVKLLSDTVFLHFGNFETIEVANLVKVNDDGSRQNYIFLNANVAAKSRTGLAALTITSSDGNIVEDNEPKEILLIIDRAKQHRSVAEALRFFQKNDWINLYKAFEIIRDDVNEPAMIQQGWTSKPNLSRFTQTAQSLDSIGDAARHASKKFKPHLQPMSLSEAKVFMKHLLTCWIQSK